MDFANFRADPSIRLGTGIAEQRRPYDAVTMMPGMERISAWSSSERARPGRSGAGEPRARMCVPGGMGRRA
jgi:hypothetical protein